MASSSVNTVTGGQTIAAVVPLKWKEFVRAKILPTKTVPLIKKYTVSVSGENVNNFYLNVIGDDKKRNIGNISSDNKNNENNSDDDIICDGVITCKKRSTTNAHFPINIINNAMKCAQLNDVANLRRLIENGLSINAVDEYGWSLLMVAACAGSESVIKYLLEKKARRGKRDSKGNTALYLASQYGHKSITELLIKSNKSDCTVIDVDKEINPNGQNINTKHFCQECNHLSECSKIKHQTSITHLFKRGPGNIEPFYGISRKNKGFQMLLQQGWNTYQGLGPDGLGKKYPIKTTLKRDRLGIGHVEEPDEPNIRPQRIEKQNVKNRKTNYLLKNKERLKEINIRRALNEPDI